MYYVFIAAQSQQYKQCNNIKALNLYYSTCTLNLCPSKILSMRNLVCYLNLLPALVHYPTFNLHSQIQLVNWLHYILCFYTFLCIYLNFTKTPPECSFGCAHLCVCVLKEPVWESSTLEKKTFQRTKTASNVNIQLTEN